MEKEIKEEKMLNLFNRIMNILKDVKIVELKDKSLTPTSAVALDLSYYLTLNNIEKVINTLGQCKLPNDIICDILNLIGERHE